MLRVFTQLARENESGGAIAFAFLKIILITVCIRFECVCVCVCVYVCVCVCVFFVCARSVFSCFYGCVSGVLPHHRPHYQLRGRIRIPLPCVACECVYTFACVCVYTFACVCVCVYIAGSGSVRILWSF